MAKVKAKVSRKRDGNVTVDLGESLERRLRAGGMAGGGYPDRPGMGAPRPGWGLTSPTLGMRLGIPQHVRTGRVLGGGLLGALGNRLLRRVTPGILGTDSEIAVDGVNALVGLVPFGFSALAGRGAANDLTVGIAIPGILQFAFDIADAGLDALGLAEPRLAGGRAQYPPRAAGNPAARMQDRLANLHGRLAAPQGGAAWQPRQIRVTQGAR